LTRSYNYQYRNWISGLEKTKPLPLSSDQMYITFGKDLNQYKSITDEIIYHPVKYRPLFGSKADPALQAIIKVVKNDRVILSDNDIKSYVLEAINLFFTLDKWEFGDTFYFSELSAYILYRLNSAITSVLLVPRQETQVFGSLHEIKSNPDEIFISCATIDDLEIISNITAQNIRASGNILNSVDQLNIGIVST
jgi:hypothetical protein